MSKTFARRIVWRDLAYWQLHHFPRLPEVPLRAHYAGMRWAPADPEASASGADGVGTGDGGGGTDGLRCDDCGAGEGNCDCGDLGDFAYGAVGNVSRSAAGPGGLRASNGSGRLSKASPLRRWQEGRTGYPLVDAGMRELRSSGWMQQSVRMVCAAFLTEYLNIHWVHGLLWFHENLVDADLAINSMMWQNAGKSGIDQWNFTMSPSSSHQDPTGAYVRRWVPEVARLPNEYVHSPWAAPGATLEVAGVFLGGTGTYPHRLVEDLERAKAENAAAIVDAKVVAGRERNDALGYDIIDVPAGSADGCGTQIRIFTVPKYRTPHGVASSAAAAGLGGGDTTNARKRAKKGQDERHGARGGRGGRGGRSARSTGGAGSAGRGGAVGGRGESGGGGGGGGSISGQPLDAAGGGVGVGAGISRPKLVPRVVARRSGTPGGSSSQQGRQKSIHEAFSSASGGVSSAAGAGGGGGA